MGMADRARYRLWQFWQAVTSEPLPAVAREEMAQILNPAELALFERQGGAERQHSYLVMRSLKAAGHDNPDLLAAALLHDAGKTKVRSFWWDRPLVVLSQALLPRLARKWSRGDGMGWSRPFVVKERHPEWGAAAAEACGSSPLTVTLISRHQELPGADDEGPETEMLKLLQWADNKS